LFEEFQGILDKALVDGLVILEEQQYVLLFRAFVPSWNHLLHHRVQMPID